MHLESSFRGYCGSQGCPTALSLGYDCHLVHNHFASPINWACTRNGDWPCRTSRLLLFGNHLVVCMVGKLDRRECYDVVSLK